MLVNEDLNGDRIADLIVGAPGTLDGTRTDPPGRVDVFFGSRGGVVAAGAISLPSHAGTGDQFGAALALGEWDEDVGSTRDQGMVIVNALPTARTSTGPGGALQHVGTVLPN